MSNLRVIQANTTLLEPSVSDQEEKWLKRLEDHTFNVRPITEYDHMDAENWKFLRMAQLYPDVVIFRMESWFGFKVDKTLEELSPEDKNEILDRILLALDAMDADHKRDLLTRIQQKEIPILFCLQRKNQIEDWRGFTTEMVTEDGRIKV